MAETIPEEAAPYVTPEIPSENILPVLVEAKLHKSCLSGATMTSDKVRSLTSYCEE